jgi:hypothetical protein
MYRLRATEYKSRIKRLRSPIDLSEFAEYPGCKVFCYIETSSNPSNTLSKLDPITQLSCARLYNSLALTVAFAQDNPKDNAKYKYSRPYVKLVETHGDLTVKQRKIINPPLTAIAPSIVETKLIPATTSPSSNQLQLSIILLDQNSSQFYLSIWHVTPGIITEALALDIDRLTCLRIMMNRKAVKQSLKLSGNGYLLHQPQKIASIILGENKDKEPLPSSINEESETETRKQAQLGPEQDESEEEEVLPTKRTRVLIVRNEAWDEVSTGSMSGGEEEGRKRRKRNKRDIIPTVVAHNSPTDSEEEEKESPSIMTATPSSVEPPSSMAVLEDEDTNMEEYVEQKIDGANETSQLDTQHSLEIPLVSEAASQQQLSHDKQLQDDQQTKANSEQPILVEKNRASLQENQSDHHRHESTEEVAKQDQIKHPADNSQSIQVQQPVQEKRELIVENLKLIEIQAIESANKDLEPAAESVKEIIEPEDIQGPEEDYTFVNKVDETITSKNISTANINEIDDNDGDYDQYDDYNPTDSYDGYENDDVKADFVSTPKNGDETYVILTSDEDEEGTQSQDEEEINDIVNHAVSEPLRIDGNQREASSVVDEEYVDPLMSHSLLYQGEIQFIPGGELYIGTDQASTTTPTTATTTSIIDIESQTSSQPSLDYIPVSNDDLLRLLNEPMTLGTNVQEADSTNTLLSMFMEDHTGSHSDGGTPALSVDFPTATFSNATTAVSSPSSPQSANEPSMTKEEEFEARMSKIALDVAQMCFETSEIDLDTLSSAKQDQMGQYCWKSNDHELKLFMMRYCHDHGMNQAVVMLGRSLLSREERSYMSTNEAKECKSILKHHLFTVHPSLREGGIYIYILLFNFF